MPEAVNRDMRPICLRLDPDAFDYLRTLCPRRTGHAAVVSRILLEHKLRRELAEQYRMAATKEEWNQTGLCVD